MCRIAKEKARSGIAMCRSRRTVATIVLAGALAAGCAMPAAALADDASQGKTQVTVVADPGQTLKFEVPMVIPFAASADGVLVGPSKEVAKITNKSVFGIHVTEVGVEAKGAWNVVADAAKAPGQTKNAIDFQFGPARQVDAASALIPADTSSDMGFNMGYAGSGTESVEIDTAGNVAHVAADLSKETSVATIVWTVAPGAAA